MLNSIYTLFFNHNYMKLYENYFGSVDYRARTQNDIRYGFNLLYENRLPIENTTDYSVIKYDPRNLH